MDELRIICCVKQTFATDATIKLLDNGQINDEKVSFIVNPYDEFAVEEALRIREARGGEITVISVGPKRVEEALRQCLAMGADRAVRIDDEGIEERDEWVTANLLSESLKRMEFDLILCGKVAVDSNAGEVPIRLTELLGLPQIHVVSKLDFKNGSVVGRRESDGAAEIIEVSLPALITAEKGLNEPRYPTLPNIIKAKRKPMDILTWQELGFSGTEDERVRPMLEVVSYLLPPERGSVTIIPGNPQESGKELIRILHEEVGVI